MKKACAGVLEGLSVALDIIHKEQRKAAKKGLGTNSMDIEAAVEKRIYEIKESSHAGRVTVGKN